MSHEDDKIKFVKQCLLDPEKRAKLGRSIMSDINDRLWVAGEVRRRSPVSQLPDVPCRICGLLDSDNGAELGCLECTVRSIMES